MEMRVENDLSGHLSVIDEEIEASVQRISVRCVNGRDDSP